MPPPKSPADPSDTPLQNRRRATQRERLIAGMIAAANRDGYAAANVSAVIEEAGISRPTFYEYFEDRQACFVGSVVDVQENLIGEIRSAVADTAPENALAATIAATVAFAAAQPGQARFLMKEALAGGPSALDARDQGIGETARIVERALRSVPPEVAIPDVPVAAVLGAVQRLLATRLRRGERALAGLTEDLLAWVGSYRTPAGKRRRRELKAEPLPERSPYLAPTALRPPPPLPPGRPRLPPGEIAENHRQRIMLATAQVVQERGYTAATIEEITRAAGVESRVFYRHFTDKQEAFSAIHELGFQYLMAVTAGAFFAARSWPERIWEAFRAATQSVDETAAFAHVAFVEAYAVGARGIQRVEDSRAAFAIFLQEGYRAQPEGAVPPPRVALEAIITTIFEIVYLQARASPRPSSAGQLGAIVHLSLVPFIGLDPAERLLAEKAAIRQRGRGRAPQRGSGRTARKPAS